MESTSPPKAARPSYLSKHGFEYDMFFSYSHGDMLGEGDAPLKLWSMQFHRALTQTLALLLKPAPRIFLDESADGVDKTARLGPELGEKVRGSALFQIIMSPHYLESEWCKSELKTFVQAVLDRGISPDGRVFIAKAMETAALAWPAALCDDDGNKMVGWEFHPRGLPFPHGFMNDWRGGLPPEISAPLIEMAVAIQGRLCSLDAALNEKEAKAGEVRRIGEGDIDKIYLYGRADEAAAWEATWKEIDGLGIAVTPGEPEPLDADDDADKRLEYARLASRCDAMLMVGSDGLKLDFDLDVIGRERRNFIASRYQKYLPCAVVDRRGDLKRTAREGNAKRFGIDWIDAHSGSWPDAVRIWLQDSAGKVGARYGLPPPPDEPEPRQL
jgi:hypothetical protein